MKVSYIAALRLPLSILMAFACPLLANGQNSPTFEVKSVGAGRSNFPVYFHQAANEKAIVLYVYGGACTFPGGKDYVNLGPALDPFLSAGLSVIVPDYRAGLESPPVKEGEETEELVKRVCPSLTESYLRDLKKVVEQVRQKWPHQKLLVWGHSYGAYLANLWALQKDKDPLVEGFISSNGWWVSTHEQFLDLLSPAQLDPLIQPDAVLSKILVTHTQDDRRISVGQVEHFRRWLDSKKDSSNARIVIFPHGGHYPLDARYPSQELVGEILEFFNLE